MHKRCLRLIYSDKRSSYEELFGKNVSVSVHYRNIQVLATGMYKVKYDLSLKIFSDLSCQTELNLYSLKIQHDFEAQFVRTVYHGRESISFFFLKNFEDLLSGNLLLKKLPGKFLKDGIKF